MQSTLRGEHRSGRDQIVCLRQSSEPVAHSEEILPPLVCVLDHRDADFNEQCTGEREFSKQSVKKLSRNRFKNKRDMNFCEGKNPPTVKHLSTPMNSIFLHSVCANVFSHPISGTRQTD
jgi:hypothetical protein